MNRTVISNGLWNVLGGMSSAIVAALVPPFLTRALPPEAYGAWSVALQIGIYVNIFGLGIQTAVGRYVAFHQGQAAVRERDTMVASAFWCVVAGSLAGVAIVGIWAINGARLFPQLSGSWQADASVATALLGLSFGIGLVGSVFGSVFLGLQRSHVPAMVQLAGRVAQALLIIVAARTRNLSLMALAHLVGSVGITWVLTQLWARRTWKPTIAPRLVSRNGLRELAGFCLSLTVWNLAMLLISGLDLIILAHYDASAVPYYSVSLTLVSLIAGTLQALAGALTPASANMQATSGPHTLVELLFRSTKLISMASLLVSAPLIFLGQDVLRVWVGVQYADHAHALLAALAAATVIRTSLLAYVMIAIGTGQQRRMILTPLIEGMTSLGLSLWWVRGYGAIGVADAKLASAAVGIGLLVLQHPLVHALPSLTRTAVIRTAVAWPGVCWLALIGAMLLMTPLRANPFLHLPAAGLAIAAVGLAASWSSIRPLLASLSNPREALS